MIRYVTRWALSTGIKKVEGEYTDNGKYFHAGGVFVSASEAFDDLDKAKAEAKKRAQAKAKRLLAQSQALSDPRWQPKICE